MIVGTAAYMSPEQAMGKPVDTRSDIFSLGSMLYQAATGTRPFRGDSSVDLLHQIIHHEPPSLSETLPEAPPQGTKGIGSRLAIFGFVTLGAGQ